MRKFLIVSLLFCQSCMAFAQYCCAGDSTFREIQFPLTEKDTETVFYYFNDEWIAGASVDMVDPDSIAKAEVKDDEYGNRAVFLTVSSETLATLKSKVAEWNKKIFVNYDPVCEFPGGNGKLKEWLEANIRIPEGYKGCERVMVKFFVQPDGTIMDPQILRPSRNAAANEEAIRLVTALPRFRVKYLAPRKSAIGIALPVTFREPGAIFIRGGENFLP